MATVTTEDNSIQFIEPFELNYGQCLGINETERFWRIRKGIEDTYSSGGLEIRVKGVIQSVSKQTLRTSSLVVDSLLGQGEALDCFNQKLQDAAAVAEQLKNLEMLQKLESIENLGDPAQRAEMYKRVFGACCDVPQTQIIS